MSALGFLATVLSVSAAGATPSLPAALTPTPGTAAADSVHPVWQTFLPPYHEQPCPFSVTRIHDRVTCGYVLVPEDRADPGTRLIRIAVARIAAEDATSQDAVIHLAGGPGGSAIDFLYLDDGAGDDIASLAGPMELILADARGTGFSEPSVCRGVAASGPVGEAQYRELMRSCLSAARMRGIALHTLSTWHLALDVKDVRRALGFDRWNLWGLSYGTRLAEAVMQVDSSGVRAVVLDSTAPALFPTGLAQGFRSSLDAIGRACAAHERCREDVGDLAGRLVNAVASFETSPLEIDGLDANFWPDGRMTIDAESVASSLFGALYSSSNYDDLPAHLSVMEERDVEAIRTALLGTSPDAPSRWGAAMGLITYCRWDPPTDDDLEAWRAAEPVIGRWILRSNFGRNARERCAKLYQIDPDPSVRPVVSDIPTLMLSGAADPITPPSFTEAVLAGLSAATVIEVPHTGHNVIAHLNRYSSGCGTELMHAFFSDPTEPVELPCAGAVPSPDFVTRLRRAPALSRFLLGLREGDRPVLPTLALLGLLWGTLAYPLAAIGRRIDGRGRTELRRVRILSWAGAAMSVGGVGLAAAVFFRMARHHQASLLVGWLPSIGWAGWLGLAGVVVAAGAGIFYYRARSREARQAGTTVGVLATAVCAVALFVFLIGLGAGPV